MGSFPIYHNKCIDLEWISSSLKFSSFRRSSGISISNLKVILRIINFVDPFFCVSLMMHTNY